MIWETWKGYGIWLPPGKRDLPKFGHGYGIGKENNVRIAMTEVLVKKKRACARDLEPRFQTLSVLKVTTGQRTGKCYWRRLPTIFKCFPFWSIDVNECSASVCDVNANCQNNIGSYVCSCNAGFTGDGNTCTGTIAPFICLTTGVGL